MAQLGCWAATATGGGSLAPAATAAALEAVLLCLHGMLGLSLQRGMTRSLVHLACLKGADARGRLKKKIQFPLKHAFALHGAQVHVLPGEMAACLRFARNVGPCWHVTASNLGL